MSNIIIIIIIVYLLLQYFVRLSFSPRQQAPPSDDADGFCLIGTRQPAVIPLTEEIAEFSGCQMQFPVDDNNVTKPEDLSNENGVKWRQDIEITKQRLSLSNGHFNCYD